MEYLNERFIHLRVQSSYSLLESALKINKIVELAKKFSMPAICIADRNNLFGSLEFSLEAEKKGLQPINAAILNLCYQKSAEEKFFGDIVVIAHSKQGYKNLLKLSSFPYTKNDRKIIEHITIEDLENHNEGIILLSGYVDGPIGKELLKNNIENAELFTQKLKEIFDDRFFFEIMRHNLDSEKTIEKNYLSIANKYQIPLVATNKVLFESLKFHDAHDVLMCISEGVVKDYPERKMVSNQCYFKSQSEMIELFKDIPSAIKNSVLIAQKCHVKSETSNPMLPNFSSEDLTENDLLKKESYEGLKKRLEHKYINENIVDENIKNNIEKKYFDRLDYELSVICNMNFSGYFLIVADFIKWSKENSIFVGPGRGSGAGSIVAWSLLITDLDPIRFGLIFERFLNPERISMPDFDIDFCQERREEVINYVRNKYGDQKVGQIITFGKLQAKAVIKDVSRVLGLKYEIADYLTELVPFNAVNPVTLEQAVNEVSELNQAYKGNGLYNYTQDNELIKQVLDTALTLEGLNRHCSVHAAGIVIAGDDLINILPLYKDINGEMQIVQYSMKYAELAGLVKFDFLGLQTLTVISKCINLLAENDIFIDLSKIDFNDSKTYKMLSNGSSVGVFQFESIGMRDTLRKLKPDCIEDLMALGALYRPGPMDNIPTYIACKHGKQKAEYLHPLLKSTLEETYGVIVYQEQVLEIARILAGYSLGSADLLRRAMGKKIKSEMEAQEKMFVEGAIKNNISENQARDIFRSVEKFAGYGFNRAHAAAYGVISYYTAYLKANYPVEFLVACMNLDIGNQDDINVFYYEARDSGIKIIKPDINKSEGYFRIGLDEQKNKYIKYAFGAIRNVTVNLGNLIAEEREKNGNFKSIVDFVERIQFKYITKRSLEFLIKSGCFDNLHKNRKQLLNSVTKLISHAQKYHEDVKTNQFSLLNSEQNSYILDESDDFSNLEKAIDEFDAIGICISSTPLDGLESLLINNNVRDILDVKYNLPFGSSKVKIAGMIQRKDARMSPRGRFITLSIADSISSTDVTIYSEEVLKNYSHLLRVKSVVVINCDSFKDEGSTKLTVTKLESIDDLINGYISEIDFSKIDYIKLSKIIEVLKDRQNKNSDDFESKSSEFEIKIPVDDKFLAVISLESNHKLTLEDYDKINFILGR